MNKKITFPELVELVAQKANTSKRVSELFLKEIFTTITQSLTEGDSVKVKGLGTFKLTSVSARKSVNVNTGQEINIPGHKKLTFVPDKELAEAVNQPFAQFETEILSEDVTDEQLAAIDTGESEVSAEVPAEEPEPTAPTVATPDVPDNEAGLAATPPPPPVVTPPLPPVATPPQPPVELPPVFTPSEEDEEDNAAEEPEPVVEPESDDSVLSTPIPVETELAPAKEAIPPTETIAPAATAPVPPVFSEETSVESSDSEGQDEQTTETQQTSLINNPEYLQSIRQMEQEFSEERIENEKDKRKVAHRAWIEGFLIGVVATLIVTLVSFRLYIMSNNSSKAPAKQEQSVEGENPDNANVESTDNATEASAANEASATGEKSQDAEPSQKEAPAALGTDTVTRSTNLSKMSRKFYGNEFFWVYIYEENKAKYSDPNNIPEGSVIVIPSPSKYGIDKDNPESVNKAKAMISSILTK